MKNTLVLIFCLLLLATAGCAGKQFTAHSHPRGKIMSIENGIATVCIFNNDTAKYGESFDVYKAVKVREVRGPAYDKGVMTGRIEIVELLDDHYARAAIVAGTVKSGQTINHID